MQDLLLFGEAADREGADKQSAEDVWLGLETEGPTEGGQGAAARAGAAAAKPSAD